MSDRVQCKDIPDMPILGFLAQRPDEFHNWCFGNDTDVSRAMPVGTPSKVVHAKMRRLIARGLVDGCDCGCRGDFVITENGLAQLEALRQQADREEPGEQQGG